MKFIFGLGNPGAKYAHTKHNIGFMVVDALARELNEEFNQTDFNSYFFSTHIGGEKILVVKPQTFMNLSGEAVIDFMNYYQGELENLLVIYDDMDMPMGKIRLRKQGSAGGHNGLKNIIHHLGVKEFNRLKIGIGRPKKEQSVISYVLSRFTEAEGEMVEGAVRLSVAAIEFWLDGHTYEETMSQFNGKR